MPLMRLNLLIKILSLKQIRFCLLQFSSRFWTVNNFFFVFVGHFSKIIDNVFITHLVLNTYNAMKDYVGFGAVHLEILITVA